MKKKYSADEIKTLSFGEAIRLRPALHFDKCFSEKNLNSLPFEVLCHAFDEYFDGVCKNIELEVRKDSVTVTYDAGISLEFTSDGITRAERIMTEMFACKNEKKHLAVGHEFCSLGMAAINHGAERCELTTVCKGKKGLYVFEKGITISKTIAPVEGEKDYTTIYIKPDNTLFGNLAFTYAGIKEKASAISSKLGDLNISILNNIGLD